jgi:hypothetical protein
MKEIDDVLLKTIGMDVQQLYSKYGHKKDWKDFLADVYEIVEKSKEITLTIQNFRKIIGHYDTQLNNINDFSFDVISIEEDYKDYEMLIDWNGRRINAVISRTKNVEGGDYNMDFRSGNIHQTYSIERSEVTIDTIIYKISYFIYNNLEQLPF